MKTSEPLVSIIIPCFNREEFILETLNSIQQQTFKNFECIVVDDGSQDSTVKIIEDFVKEDIRFKLLQRDRAPKGANTCRNVGFEKSVGDYIVWFDSDDIMLPNYLELQVESVSKEGFDFSICYLEKFDSETGEISNFYTNDWNIKDAIGFIRGYVLYVWGVVTDSFIWKREFIEKNSHLFDESLVHADEYEYISRLLISNAFTFNSVNQILFRYRQHANNYAAQISSGNETKILSHLKSKKLVLKLLVENDMLDAELKNHFLSNVVYYMHEYRLAVISRSLDEVLSVFEYSARKRTLLVGLLNQLYLNSDSKVTPYELCVFINSRPSSAAIAVYPKMYRLMRLRQLALKKAKSLIDF